MNIYKINMWKMALAGVSMLALSGCAGFTGQFNVNKMNEAQITGSEFTQHLANTYKKNMNYEWDEMYDYKDGNIYAKKGLRAAGGEEVKPENPADWDLPAHTIADITKGYNDLNGRLATGIQHKMPEMAAKAQTSYDCWVEQQEENFQWDEIAKCRADFMMAMHQIGGTMPEADHMIFFNTGKHDLSKMSTEELDKAYAHYKMDNTHFVIIYGHTDTQGKADMNDTLSMNRAKQAADYLIMKGVPADHISFEGFGEKYLNVPTKDGVKNQKNRRDAIYVY